MKQTNYSEWVDRYLDGELEGKELETFLTEMNMNPDLKEEVQFQRELADSIRADDEIQLRNQLEVIHKDLENKKLLPTVAGMLPRWSKVAVASVVILLMGYGTVQVLDGNMSNQELFEKHYKSYEMPNYRAGGGDIDDSFLKGIEYLDRGEYVSAIKCFEEVLDQDMNRMDANFMSGIASMEDKDYEKADGKLSTVIKHDDNVFVEHAEWYLGLCYLSTGSDEKLGTHLEDIINRDGFYANDARKLKRQVKR